MAIPADFSPHSPANQYAGTIHFREQSYLQDEAQDGWSLLQFDSPFSGDSNFTMAPSLKAGSSITIGASSVSISGTALDQVISVRYASTLLTPRLTTTSPTQLVVDLPSSISGQAGKEHNPIC